MSRLYSFNRALNLDFGETKAIILLGPRKVGKTTYLRNKFPQAIVFDLLKTDLRVNFQFRPSLLREMVLEKPNQLYIIDEVQKAPELLDEVHWLLENTKARFILCGSSAKKLKRGAANLLGGRAYKYEMYPLVFSEVDDFDLNKAINHGLIPQHYQSKNPNRFLASYVEQYLQEEIISESHIRKLNSFHRFLEVSALMNGELLNYAKVGADCGVSGKTVREYYQILEDTLLGFTLPPFRKVKTRLLIETAKFYLFDTGVIRTLKEIDFVPAKTVEFGNLFETLLVNEIRAYLSYQNSLLKMSFWKTTSNFEVDLIVGSMKCAIEFKSTDRVRNDDFKGLKALLEEHAPEHALLVCRESVSRKLANGILILPVEKFLQQLWSGKFF